MSNTVEEVELPTNIRQIVENKVTETVKSQEHNSIRDDRIHKSTNKNNDLDNRINLINHQITRRKLNIREQLMYDILKKEDEMCKPRNHMRIAILIFLFIQLLFLACLIIYVLHSKITTDAFSDDVFLQVIDFIKFYIIVIVAEFISIIYFMVKYLFNTKLIDVLKTWFEKI